MDRKIFILVPAPEPSGPVKGAIALANALASLREITLVTLKPGPGWGASLDTRVNHISLSDVDGGFANRVKAYAKLLKHAGGRERVASISMCFSADMVNFLCRRHAAICSSVRGNLLTNYRMEYGFLGIPLAITHLITLNVFDHVVAMTSPMADQVGFYVRRSPTVIGNFVDEQALDSYRQLKEFNGPKRFVFLGSLTNRKQPLLLVESLAAIRKKGIDATLDIIGTGPLMSKLLKEVEKQGVQNVVRFHGHLAVPHPIVAGADALVLPSLSEGVSRAAMEALHLGTPCVLRNVDGNAELVKSGFNGMLFESDDQLPAAMLEASEISRRIDGNGQSLLFDDFRQIRAARRYLELVESCL